MQEPTLTDLLDIDWLIRTHATAGFGTLLNHVQRGAEVYGGPVTAIADALTANRWLAKLRSVDEIDLRNGLAHGLVSGSWTPDPEGPQAHARHNNGSCSLWMLPREKRAQHLAASSNAPCEPPLPDLHRLRLIEPVDRAWIGHSDGIWSCDVSRDGQFMASASRAGDVAVWEMERGTLVARADTGEREVRDCAISPDGQRVVSVHASGKVTVWDLRSMRLLHAFDAPPDRPRSDEARALYEVTLRVSGRRAKRIAISPEGRSLAVGGWDAVDVWDLCTHEHVTSLRVAPSLPPGTLALAFGSETSLSIVGRHYSAPVVTWNLLAPASPQGAGLLVPEPALIERALVSADMRCLVAVSRTETTVMRTCGAVARVATGSVGQALAVSTDGTLAATCSRDAGGDERAGVLRVWSLPDLHELWRQPLRPLGCRDIACALAFTPDGRHLILAGWEGVLRRVVLPSL